MTQRLRGSPRPHLARQLARRVSIAVAITLLTLSALVAWLETASEAELRSRTSMLRETHLQDAWTDEDRFWQDRIAAFRAQLEFQRFLETPGDKRWLDLHALLTAMGEGLPFQAMVVRKGGRWLFDYGLTPQARLRLEAPGAVDDWLAVPEERTLYRVVRLALWLGREGEAEALFLRPMDAGWLRRISAPDEQLALLPPQGDPWALGTALRQDTSQPHMLETHTLALRDPRLPPGFRLASRSVTLRGTHARLYPWITAMAALFLLAGLWLVLARWGRHTVKRVERLVQAARAFAAIGMVSEAVETPIRQAAGSDELGHLAQELLKLMHETEQRQKEARRHLQTVALLEEAILEFDPQGRIVTASAAWQRLSGLPLDKAAGVSLAQLLAPESANAWRDALADCRRGKTDGIHLRLCLLGSEEVRNDTWLECRLVAERDASGALLGLRGALRDITLTYHQERQITYMALHDALTGLPNRVLLEDRAKSALRLAQREREKAALIFIDLDHFKQVNDTMGHKAGDKLLLAYAQAVRGRIRAGDTLARWGGDEFVLLLPALNDTQAARQVCDKILELATQPLEVEDMRYTITCSLGVAVYPDDGENVDELLARADQAMFYAKSQGRNACWFYQDMRRKGLGRKELYLQQRLAQAIQHGHIQAWYQPLIAADSRKVKGVEVLARWQDEDGDWISPATFIPMAENLGLIRELSEQVMHKALRLGGELVREGVNLELAMNVSRRQLFAPDFIQWLRSMIRQAGIAPQQITLEITESMAMLDAEQASERLRELAEHGFRLAIDDFGTGYSSLSLLHDMPVHEIKIDMSFVRRLHTPEGRRVVQAILSLAHALHLDTVAEGVEDEATARTLLEMGVTTMQGYHFAKPMHETATRQWLASSPYGLAI